MLLGIVTDIHDEVDKLRRALVVFEQEGVDLVLSLGDAVETYETGQAGVEVFRLLRDAGAIGVWGNHDAGLSLLWTERIKAMIDPSVRAFASTLKSHLVIEDCRFSHIEPWLDASELRDLWHYDGPPDTVSKAQRSFHRVSERHLFMGHFHRWLVMTPEGRLDWKGEAPIQLSRDNRHLIVIAELMHGWFATFDTDTAELTPFRLQLAQPSSEAGAEYVVLPVVSCSTSRMRRSQLHHHRVDAQASSTRWWREVQHDITRLDAL